MRAYIHAYECLCMQMFACLCICVHMYACVCIYQGFIKITALRGVFDNECICGHIFTHMNAYVCICLHIYACVCICMHLYAYVCIHQDLSKNLSFEGGISQ